MQNLKFERERELVDPQRWSLNTAVGRRLAYQGATMNDLVGRTPEEDGALVGAMERHQEEMRPTMMATRLGEVVATPIRWCSPKVGATATVSNGSLLWGRGRMLPT